MSAPRIALVGNPNSGKTSLFNQLTGLRQRTGNFPGVTVEHVSGTTTLGGHAAEVTDLPGTYSLHPTSLDERVVMECLLGYLPGTRPDAVLFVADIAKLDRHLLLLTQVIDLGYPTVLALNFADEHAGAPEAVAPEELDRLLRVPVVAVSARTGEGLDRLRTVLAQALTRAGAASRQNGALAGHADAPGTEVRWFEPSRQEQAMLGVLAEADYGDTDFGRLLSLHHATERQLAPGLKAAALEAGGGTAVAEWRSLQSQVRETMQRYDRFTPRLRAAKDAGPDALTDRLDAVLTHPVAGPIVFLLVLLLVFQAIFTWSALPSDLIEVAFATLGDGVREVLPYSASSGRALGYLADFLVDGLLAGLAGIMVFVPPIALLFLLLSVLEEVGYMARAVFLSDRLMQRFGLNGRSLVALTSSGACAIPAIMSARTIANPKERLITILVSPLISCSARIPVYAILIGFAVPAVTVLGVFNAQALAFVGIYLASAAAALLAALFFKWAFPDAEPSYLMMELPSYRVPAWRNVGITVYNKTRSFVLGAGRIILAISIVLWVAASFGPGDRMAAAEASAAAAAARLGAGETETADLVANARLEASFAGHVGRAIEPAIAPLGYDWKIGIALLSSFAAREVFVGTIATLYAIGSAEEDEARITERLSEARRPDGTAVYTAATAASLIVFYLFAMQCMSTLAVTRRETGTWKWPMVQLAYMTILAYVGAWAVYRAMA